LTGIGPYTADAIASIAFNQVVPAVDGNAFRVFARLLLIDADIAQPKTRQLFTDIIQPIVDPQRPGAFNQAIMDLGASYMTTKNSRPAESPVRAFDASYRLGKVADYPVKTKAPRPKLMPYYGLIVQSPAGVLLVQRQATEMLTGYWTYPLVLQDDLRDAETEPVTVATDIATLERRWRQDYQLPVSFKVVGGPVVSHTYTHQRWHVKLLVATFETTPDLTFYPGKWVPVDAITELPLPKVQEKMMRRWAERQATTTK